MSSQVTYTIYVRARRTIDDQLQYCILQGHCILPPPTAALMAIYTMNPPNALPNPAQRGPITNSEMQIFMALSTTWTRPGARHDSTSASHLNTVWTTLSTWLGSITTAQTANDHGIQLGLSIVAALFHTVGEEATMEHVNTRDEDDEIRELWRGIREVHIPAMEFIADGVRDGRMRLSSGGELAMARKCGLVGEMLRGMVASFRNILNE